MNDEHQLQQHLTELWLDYGAVIAGERLFLAAWEVVDNYGINSAHTADRGTLPGRLGACWGTALG